MSMPVYSSAGVAYQSPFLTENLAPFSAERIAE